MPRRNEPPQPPVVDPRLATAAGVEVVPISELRLWDRNPHTGDVGAIRESLRRWGQVIPILRSGEGWIVSGNQTLKAMIEEGFEAAAVVTRDGSRSDLEALGLAMNRLASLGQDDDAQVLALLREIEAFEGTGYTADDIADLEAMLQELDSATSRSRYAMNDETGLTDSEPSYAEREDAYGESRVRSIVLDYPIDVYADVTSLAQTLRSMLHLDSNAELFRELLLRESARVTTNA